jgi:hypothetical protein
MAELIEEEVTEVVGREGKHNPDRIAVRRGHESGEVTLGGRRVAVERPRVRTTDGGTRWPVRPHKTYVHTTSRAFGDLRHALRSMARAKPEGRLEAVEDDFLERLVGR